MFDVVALKEKLSVVGQNKLVTKEEIAQAIEGKVLGWGRWMGLFERARG